MIMKVTVNDVKDFLSNYGFSEFTLYVKAFNVVCYNDDLVYFIKGLDEHPYLKIGKPRIKCKTIELFKNLEKTYPNIFKVGTKNINNENLVVLYINI